jgi:hypothetical protein
MITKLEQTPAYRKLKKDIEYYFKAVDGIEGYRDGDFKEDPIDALQDEADFCKDTADFLGSINFRGFNKDKQQELMKDTAADMEYLDRSALRLTNLLKKQDNSMYLKSDGSVNVNTNQKPGEYARRALRKIRDLFARLGQAWDYDPDFDYKSLPAVDYKMYVADSKLKENKALKEEKYTETNNVEIELTFEPGDEKTGKELENHLEKLGLSVDLNIEEGYLEAETEETVNCDYTPAVYWLSNGDPGYPAEYDDDREYFEDDLRSEISSWDKDLDFEIESVRCSMEESLRSISLRTTKLWKRDIMNVVNTAIIEGVNDREALLNMAKDMNLGEEQRQYLEKYVYYILD